MDFHPCPICTVSWGLRSWGSFRWFNISNVFGGCSKMVQWTCTNFRAIGLAWSTNFLSGLHYFHRVAVFLTALVWGFLRTFVSPLVTCFLGGSPEFLDGLLSRMRVLGIFSLNYIFLGPWRRRAWWDVLPSLRQDLVCSPLSSCYVRRIELNRVNRINCQYCSSGFLLPNYLGT